MTLGPRHIVALLLVLFVVTLRASKLSGRITLSVGDVQFEFVRVKPGEFMIGSSEGNGDERPVHKVNIDYGFEVGKPEVTTGDYAGNLYEMAWFDQTGIGGTSPVAVKKPNAWGLYDMHGNVWQWVQDVWHMGCDGAPTDGSAWLQADSLTLTMRGGSFANPPWWLCSYIHMRNDPPCRLSYNHGFRLVMDVCRHRKTLQPNR